MEQEHLRAAMPPDWPVGMTWVIEGMAPHDSRYALEERHNTAAWTGEIELRVVENDGFEAVLEATIRPERSTSAPFAWSMRYAMDPFGVMAVRTVALERNVDSSHWVLGGGTSTSGWVLELPQAPDAPFFRQEEIVADLIPSVSFDAHGIWLEEPDWSPITAERLTRRTLWRAGDPWPAITEALDENGRPARSIRPPARFRLIEIDGERIGPVPWIAAHRR